MQRLFRSPKGCGLCPDGIIRFFGKKCLKNALYKIFYQTEVVKNQNLQLLCYVIFFDILHHYGVIAASQICCVSRKYCDVLRNRFFLLLFSTLICSSFSIYVTDAQILSVALLFISIYVTDAQVLSGIFMEDTHNALLHCCYRSC